MDTLVTGRVGVGGGVGVGEGEGAGEGESVGETGGSVSGGSVSGGTFVGGANTVGIASSGSQLLTAVYAIQISVAYILAAMLAVRALLRVPAIARRVPVGLTALFGLMLIGLSSLIPNLLAINGAVNPSGFPFNISGITVKSALTAKKAPVTE